MWFYLFAGITNLAFFFLPLPADENIVVAFIFGMAVCALVLGFISLTLIYYRQRENFGFVFGLWLGFSALNGGLNNMPVPQTPVGQIAQLAVSSIIPFALAWVLRTIIQRADKVTHNEQPAP
jgi:hypothetical protein